MDKNGKRYKKCGKMISRKSNLNPHIAININKAMETEFLEMSLIVLTVIKSLALKMNYELTCS